MRIYKHLTVNSIKLENFEFFRELAMQAYLIENQEIITLDDDDLSQFEILDIEVPIPEGRKKKNTDGRIDLFGKFTENTFGLIEIKNGILNKDHLSQLEDYLSVRNKLQIEGENINIDSNWIGLLIGTDIETELANQISNGLALDDLKIPVAAIILKRFRGNDGSVFVLSEVYFKNTSRNFDRSKYKFKNSPRLGKGRLVLNIIKDYVQQNPMISFSELKSKFPDKIQGSHGVFHTYSSALEIKERSGHKRHFLGEDEKIILADQEIAVSTQWGVRNIDNFIENASKYGYKVVKEES